METVKDFVFLGSKITADGDCSHEVKRWLLLGRKDMTNLDSILKSRDIPLLTKVHIVKAACLIAQLVKSSACSAGNPALIPRSGRSLEKEMASHSSILPGESHGQRSLVGTVHGIARVGHDLATKPPPPQFFQ